MQNLIETLKGLDTKRKIAAGVAILVVVLGVLAIGRIGSSVQMELLYSGLDSAAAGEVVTELEARGVAHEVRGAAIYVDARQRDRLRMALAAQGIPVVGARGYELLDDLPGFGTTSQMFDAAYWRAKEGELARTIVAAPHIRSARVHLSPANSRPFQRDGRASAAVTVTSATGGLTPAQANALRHLLAASISSLAVEDVAVIDDVGGLIAQTDEGVTAAGGPLGIQLRDRVERLLSARVGPGNAVVEVSVEQVTERETLLERRFDPEGRVAVSAETEKRTENQQGGGGAGVTVASNLPDGAGAEGAEGGTASSTSETRERTNFEVSELHREVERAPGDIKRLTVAVLLNEAEAGPRPPEEIEALRALVASAVGFDAARGDEITIESMGFVAQAGAGGGATAVSTAGLGLDLMQLIQLVVAAVVVLVLGLFVLRPVLTSAPRAALAPPPGDAPDAPEGEMPEMAQAALPDLGQGFASLPDPAGFGGFDIAGHDAGGESPVSRLKSLISERQEESLQLLQSWVEAPADPPRGAS